MSAGTAVLVVAVVLRVTRLVTADKILERPRTRFAALGEWPAAFIVCPWCVSVWVAAPVTVAGWAADGAAWFVVPAVGCAASWAAGAVGFLGVYDD